MKKSFSMLLVVLLISALSLAACGGDAAEEPDAEAGDRPEPPAEFASLEYPHPDPNEEVLASGEQLYLNYCASCHGNEGAGDGPAAAALNPAPADLAETGDQASPQYMYWRISEGGAFAPFNSSMPAFDGVLNEDQIWAVVAYIQAFD